MRVSKEKAAENREALLRAAGRLFRERGIDGVGVADIGKEAGLTHGALYAHFGSKEELAAEAFAKGFERSIASLQAVEHGRASPMQAYLSFLFSPLIRDTVAMGCPLVASASEIARQGDAVASTFGVGFEKMVEAVEAAVDPAQSPAERRAYAMTVIACYTGAVAIARALAKTDAALSDEMLRSARKVLGKAAEPASTHATASRPAVKVRSAVMKKKTARATSNPKTVTPRKSAKPLKSRTPR